MGRRPFVDGAFDFWQLYDNGEWEPETREVLARFLKPGAQFCDVGAWIGPVTLWAVELGATVLALEPDPVARKQLRENTYGMPVRINPRALAPSVGYGLLHNRRGWYGDSMSFLAAEGKRVRTTTPARLLDGYTPDLLKLDIEGGEMSVLPFLLPICRDRQIPVWVSFHHDSGYGEWFEGFTVEGSTGAWSQALLIPES